MQLCGLIARRRTYMSGSAVKAARSISAPRRGSRLLHLRASQSIAQRRDRPESPAGEFTVTANR